MTPLLFDYVMSEEKLVIDVIDNGGQWTHREWRMYRYLGVETQILSNKTSLFDIKIALVFAVLAYILNKLGFALVSVLLGLVLGPITEENFRRSLILSEGSWKIFFSSPVSISLILIIVLSLFVIIKGKRGEKSEGILNNAT